MIAAMTSYELAFWLSGCVVFVAIFGLFSGSEIGLYCVNQTRLRLAVHRGKPEAVRLQALFADRAGLLFTTLLAQNLANYLAPVCLTIAFLETLATDTAEVRERRAELYTTIILTPVVFVFGEVVPKNLFQRSADQLMHRISGLLRVTHVLFQMTGLVWLQRRISEFMISRLNRTPTSGSALHTRLDIYQMLREGAAEGALSLTQSAILERVHRLESVQVRTVMVPWNQVQMLPADATREQIESLIRQARHSRLPVYRDDRRNIVGVVHIIDVLTSPAGKPLGDMMRRPIELDADIPVRDALLTLQRECRRMAIVIDPRGRCLGILTVKDLVEEIIGELAAW